MVKKMLKEISIENKCIISVSTAFSVVSKVIPQVELELQKRCKRSKSFIILNYEINVKYEKDKLTFFISRKRLYKMDYKIIQGDAFEVLKTLADESIDCCITSPPYFNLRDYGMDGQIGLEKTPQNYVAKLVSVFKEVKRVLKRDGTLWVNIGDCYAGSGKGAAVYEAKGIQASHIGSITSPKIANCKWGGGKT